jgi:hypothetical protein
MELELAAMNSAPDCFVERDVWDKMLMSSKTEYGDIV